MSLFIFKPMYLFLIDLEKTDPAILDVWGSSGFLTKIENISGSVAIWDPEGNHQENSVLPPLHLIFNNFKKLVNYIDNIDIDYLVHVFGDQLFLDLEIVKNGLDKAANASADYFTQWEHCRLPLGIGIRAVSRSAFLSTNANSIENAFTQILKTPQKYHFAYENQKYVSFDLAMLDSRVTPDWLTAHSQTVPSYDLNGFLYLADKEKIPAYKQRANAAIIDERGFPCSFGFESPACAEFPTYIMFDITNTCNSKCIHCPHSTILAGKDFEPKYLSMVNFKKAIDECKVRNIHFVRLTADGEPLLHPNLFEMIEYAVEAGVGPVGLTTNGSLLDARKTQKLIESGIFMVDISLDAIKKETYKKIRHGLSFEKTMKNVKYLIETNKKANSPVRIMVSFVKQQANLGELKTFEKYWEPLVDRVLIREIISNISLVDISESKKHSATKRWPCPHWFRRIVINYNGVIKACPIDWKNETSYTSLSETTIYDAWHSDFYWKNRMEHLNNQFSSQSACRDCIDWQDTPWDLGYEKVIKTFTRTKVE